MDVIIREYTKEDVKAVMAIWNEAVEDGTAFLTENALTEESAAAFFEGQTYTGVAADKETGEIYGLYVLDACNFGRSSHVVNACYAVRSDMRGQKIGKALVADSIKTAKEKGFGSIYLNTVFRMNRAARFLFVNMGFVPLGTFFKAFRMNDGTYDDIVPYFYNLD